MSVPVWGIEDEGWRNQVDSKLWLFYFRKRVRARNDIEDIEGDWFGVLWRHVESWRT